MGWMKQDCYDAVIECQRELGKYPGRDEYRMWAKGKDVPSTQMFVTFWGSWTMARLVITQGDMHEKQNEAARIRNSKNAKKKAPVRMCPLCKKPLVQPVKCCNFENGRNVEVCVLCSDELDAGDKGMWTMLRRILV